jgi:hypothetical protein
MKNAAAPKIRFLKHAVTNGEIKARVFYSDGQICRDGKPLECVTLYGRDYSDALGKIFSNGYENDTDLMTDYFDQGRVRIFPSDPLYAEVKARIALNKAAK